MHVGHRTDPRLTNRRGIQHDSHATADSPLVQGRQFHEQVMGMLPVVQGLAPEGFTALEQQRVATGTDGRGSALAIPWRWSVPPPTWRIAISMPQLMLPS